MQTRRCIPCKLIDEAPNAAEVDAPERGPAADPPAPPSMESTTAQAAPLVDSHEDKPTFVREAGKPEETPGGESFDDDAKSRSSSIISRLSAALDSFGVDDDDDDEVCTHIPSPPPAPLATVDFPLEHTELSVWLFSRQCSPTSLSAQDDGDPWEEVVDEGTGQTYYHNKITGQTASVFFVCLLRQARRFLVDMFS